MIDFSCWIRRNEICPYLVPRPRRSSPDIFDACVALIILHSVYLNLTKKSVDVLH